MSDDEIIIRRTYLSTEFYDKNMKKIGSRKIVLNRSEYRHLRNELRMLCKKINSLYKEEDTIVIREGKTNV